VPASWKRGESRRQAGRSGRQAFFSTHSLAVRTHRILSIDVSEWLNVTAALAASIRAFGPAGNAIRVAVPALSRRRPVDGSAQTEDGFDLPASSALAAARPIR
jgi:hypothetical protein